MPWAELMAVTCHVEKMKGRNEENDAVINSDCAYVRKRSVKEPGSTASNRQNTEERARK